MEENIDQNQSGLPVKDEENKEPTQPQHPFDDNNEKQESGMIEADEQPEPTNMAELINQVPRMVNELRIFE